MRGHIFVRVVGASLLVVSAAGCYPPIPEPPAPVSGYSWCVYADPAQGWNDEIPGSYESIIEPVTGLWMSACTCYCPEDHAVMLAGVNGTLVPGSSAEAFYTDQLALLRTAAEIACLQRALELQMDLDTTLDFEVEGAVSCQAAVADEEPQFGGECPFDDAQCQDGATAGVETQDPGSSTAHDTSASADTRSDTADTTAAPDTSSTTADSSSTSTESSGSDGGGVMIDALRAR